MQFGMAPVRGSRGDQPFTHERIKLSKNVPQGPTRFIYFATHFLYKHGRSLRHVIFWLIRLRKKVIIYKRVSRSIDFLPRLRQTGRFFGALFVKLVA